MRRWIWACAVLFAPTELQAAPALNDGPWSATFYIGPSTDSHFTFIIHGHAQMNGVLEGLAGDVRLVRIGGGVSLGWEGQLTANEGKYSYETAATGPILRYDFTGPGGWPTSLAVSMGPSYAIHPPRGRYLTGKALLNFVGLEYALGTPHSHGWELAVRIYHRSGMWGVYSDNSDNGMAFGIGLRKRF